MLKVVIIIQILDLDVPRPTLENARIIKNSRYEIPYPTRGGTNWAVIRLEETISELDQIG